MTNVKMMRVALCLLGLVAAGCGNPGPGNDAGTSADYDCTDAVSVTTATLQTEIFETRCKTCHNTDTAAQPGNMSTVALTQALVGKASAYAVTTGSTLKWIDPSNPQNSTMYLKVLGGGNKYKGPKGEVAGGLMPQGQTPLSAAEKKKIRDWICTGAVQQ